MADNQPTSNTAEEWRPVVGWENRYEVSDHGRVRSVDRIVPSGQGRTRKHKGRILKPGTVRGAYQFVNLSRKDGARVPRANSRYVHQLVLEAFVGPRPEGMETCHNDGDPKNNHLNNLRWDTPSANSYDTVRHGRNWATRKTHCKSGHEFTPENTYEQRGGRRGCKTCRIAASRDSLARLRGGERELSISKTHCKRGHKLSDPNLVPSSLPQRSCLACSRGRNNVARSGMKDLLQEISDSYYEQIMAQ